MYGYLGKKLNFMGNEIVQVLEWNYDSLVDWLLLQFDKYVGIQCLYCDLNVFYKYYFVLYEGDYDYGSFSWIDYENVD